jgi:hypothetical protein
MSIPFFETFVYSYSIRILNSFTCTLGAAITAYDKGLFFPSDYDDAPHFLGAVSFLDPPHVSENLTHYLIRPLHSL